MYSEEAELGSPVSFAIYIPNWYIPSRLVFYGNGANIASMSTSTPYTSYCVKLSAYPAKP